jgi:hypothetical protein
MVSGILIAYIFLNFSKTQTSAMQWHIPATRFDFGFLITLFLAILIFFNLDIGSMW